MDKKKEISNAAEIFVFMDNQHAESDFYCKTAKSLGELELMFCQHKILIKDYAYIHIIWIASRRMIDHGMDGLSRSDLTSGVMHGASMLNYVPLVHSKLEHQGPLIMKFFVEVTPADKAFHHMSLAEWYFLLHDKSGMYLWAPLPCIADIAIFALAEAQHI
ncbi:hypothetical protein ACA910_010065 [Epithemia clementina (nom. ined.)]